MMTMQTLLAPRASAVLYDLLLSRNDRRPFLLPANICPIVPITFFKAKIPFEFVDISPDNLHIDLDQAEARLCTGGYGGLLYVHTYGDPFTPQEFFHSVRERYPNILLVDDRCLCIPDLEPDPSSAADVTLYSTGEAKFVELGFGGYAFLNSGVNLQHQRLSFDFRDLEALKNTYDRSIETGTPYSYHDTNWLETDSDLPLWSEYTVLVRDALEKSLAQRKALNEVYTQLIPSELCLAQNYQLWRFNVQVATKQKALDSIFAAGLFASSHYESLVGIMGTGSAPKAKHLADRVINLFNDRHYTLDMAEQTANIILRSL
jgi:hypothetical protein